ncbi:MAG TPA: hypothetical protein PLJ35_05080 [Anaerolineae bacterium]|nr:hypothetical protein [Anaerolineae bacterium]
MADDKHRSSRILTTGQVPVAPNERHPEDRQTCPQAQAAKAASAAYASASTTHRQDWRSVKCPAYRKLGDAIYHLEAIMRGLEELAGEGDGNVTVPMSTSEFAACRRGACLRVLAALEESLQAALDFDPRQGEDLELVVVRVRRHEIGA